jgi:hypothetical protein
VELTRGTPPGERPRADRADSGGERGTPAVPASPLRPPEAREGLTEPADFGKRALAEAVEGKRPQLAEELPV